MNQIIVLEEKQEEAKKVVEMYKNGKSAAKIAKFYNISLRITKRYLKESGITMRKNNEYKREFLPKCSKEDLYDLYITKKISAEDIAKQFNVYKNTIWNWAKFYNITPPSRKERAQERTCFGHQSWKGGITPFRTLLTTRLLDWRKNILIRDNYKCQKCEAGRNLEVHHTKPLRIIIKEFKESFPNIDISIDRDIDFALKTIVSMHSLEMGVALCKNCHAEVDVYRRRSLTKE